MNKYEPHLYVVPEDRADGELAGGFALHHQVDDRRLQVVPPPGGWRNVLDTFRDEYIPALRKFPRGHVLLLIDFDGQGERRKAEFDVAIPEDLKPRVFVIGPERNPELLKANVGATWESIGKSLAENCDDDRTGLWGHEQLRHNEAERRRLVRIVKPFLFRPATAET